MLYVLHLYLYYMCVFYVDKVAFQGQRSMNNGYLRIQDRMHIFEKTKSWQALNHVLIG